MRWLGVTSVAMLLSQAALAQQAILPQVEQHADGRQDADNFIATSTLETLTDTFMNGMLDFARTGNLSQNGANTINTAVANGDIDRVRQRFYGTQSISNVVALGAVDLSGELSQSGTNMANAVTARMLNFADQLLGPDGRQLVFNDAELAILSGVVTQYGMNTANYAKAELAIGTAVQDIAEGAVQRVDNRLEVAAMLVASAAINQYGENFGNIMISDTVDSVVRNFAGDQIVRNVVYLGDGEAGEINQHGSNIANLIMSSRIGSLKQTSVGMQVVTNQVFDANNNLVTGGNINQTSSDLVNMIVLTAPSEGGDGAVISVEQAAEYPQSSTGSGGSSQTGNSLTVNR